MKELRRLATALSATEFRRQLGPFALIQRPEDVRAAAASLELGAGRTAKRVLGGVEPSQIALLFEWDALMVATLPPLQRTDALTVGRMPDCDVMLEDPSVSKRHAVLRWDALAERCSVMDPGSTNGTLLNGSVAGKAEAVLRDGDSLAFGDVQFCFLLTDSLYRRLLPMRSVPV